MPPKMEETMKTKTITKGAILVALATVLSFVTIFKAPNGGSVTAASMVPIIIMALSSKFGAGLLTALVYVAVQLVTGFYPPPTQDFLSFTLVILLDYVVAFGVLGFAGVIAKGFKNRLMGAGVATVVVCAVRYVCHFLSGILIWDVYAPEGVPVWLYSLTYNGGYMLFETTISVLVIVLLLKASPKLFAEK